MGLFSKIFNRKKIVENVDCKRLMNLEEYMNSLLAQNQYISRKEYVSRLLEDKETIEHFEILEKNDLFNALCTKNHISVKEAKNTITQYKNFEKIVDQHNDNYIRQELIKEKDYLDHILEEVDPNIRLDDDQRKVILTDEDYCLVIAGAGAGKTTTVAAKVKYLVEKKHIDPSQILVVSFTNKAVQELRDKLNKDMKIDCPIATFHSTGNAILHKESQEKLNILDSAKLYFILLDYFKSSVLTNTSLVNNLILFFGSYFDAPYEGDDLNAFFNTIAKSNYSTMRSDLEDFKRQVIDTRTKKMVTIQNEVMRSYQEVEIANFFYLNQIDYEYEPMYPYDIMFSKKPYTPDFIIKEGDKVAYLEHFGISEDGKSNRFSDDELQAYKKAINDKVKLHRSHGTKLLYTFSSYNDHRPLIDHLKEELENNGFELHPRSNQEIMQKLVASEENRYIRKLVNLVCRFIRNFKTNGYKAEDFNRMAHSTQNVRTRLFLDICNDCYLEYERYLKENNAVDFEDMINESARILKEVKEMKKKLDFKYIIVDEYQDISKQRYDLVTALSEVTNAKIIAVGDDWQSIYAFSGSDISLFTQFEQKMGYAKLLKIVNTYRNSQEVIDIAGNFVQKNKSQISKDLKSNKSITDPVIIYTYDESYKAKNADRKTGKDYALASAVVKALDQIVEYNKQEGKPLNSSILLIGRFGFDGDHLERTGLFEYIDRGSKVRCVKYPKLNITFMTAHASKGLGYDNVIILNGRNEMYGFPAKIEDDPVLSLVVKEDRSYEYAEERRLFYVALTRTKNRVYIVAPMSNPSEFLLEIKNDYKNVVLKGNWNEESASSPIARKVCPICGYPLQYRYKNAYGLRLYLCTNEPEVCGFMTNEYKAGKLSIIKCDSCRDGYLIVKNAKKRQEFFLGCTNYTNDGLGCNRSISSREYYEMFNLIDVNIPPLEQELVSLSKKLSKPKQQVIEEEKVSIVQAETKKVLYQNKDLNEVVYTILNCLYHISEKKYYGTTTLVDVLRGSNSKKIFRNNLNQVKEYGILKDVSREDIEVIIDWLIENHFILKTKHPKYPVLHITDDSLNYNKTMTTRKLKKLLEKLEDR